VHPHKREVRSTILTRMKRMEYLIGSVSPGYIDRSN
jgi:hypothetical protein